MEERIKQLENKVDTLTKGIQALTSILELALNKIDVNHLSFDKRFESINSKLTELKGDSVHTIVTLEHGFNDLKSEISKINEVTGYSDMLANADPFKKDFPAN